MYSQDATFIYFYTVRKFNFFSSKQIKISTISPPKETIIEMSTNRETSYTTDIFCHSNFDLYLSSPYYPLMVMAKRLDKF